MTPVVLPRRSRPLVAVPLTSLVDVLLILLIFFMITSTYLHLNMVPMVETRAGPPPAPAGDAGGGAADAVLVRLDAGGRVAVIGSEGEAAAAAELARRLAERPDAAVVVLPSPRAPLQALVDLLDAIRAEGGRRVQVVRLDPAEVP